MEGPDPAFFDANKKCLLGIITRRISWDQIREENGHEAREQHDVAIYFYTRIHSSSLHAYRGSLLLVGRYFGIQTGWGHRNQSAVSLKLTGCRILASAFATNRPLIDAVGQTASRETGTGRIAWPAVDAAILGPTHCRPPLLGGHQERASSVASPGLQPIAAWLIGEQRASPQIAATGAPHNAQAARMRRCRD
jgi:hypothetical protein